MHQLSYRLGMFELQLGAIKMQDWTLPRYRLGMFELQPIDPTTLALMKTLLSLGHV